jgi:hypothetical protein
VLPGRAGSHPGGVLAGQAMLQPSGEDGFGLVPQAYPAASQGSTMSAGMSAAGPTGGMRSHTYQVTMA